MDQEHRDLLADERPVAEPGQRQRDADAETDDLTDDLGEGQPEESEVAVEVGAELCGDAVEQEGRGQCDRHELQPRIVVEVRDEAGAGADHCGQNQPDARVDPEQVALLLGRTVLAWMAADDSPKSRNTSPTPMIASTIASTP